MIFFAGLFLFLMVHRNRYRILKIHSVFLLWAYCDSFVFNHPGVSGKTQHNWGLLALTCRTIEQHHQAQNCHLSYHTSGCYPPLWRGGWKALNHRHSITLCKWHRCSIVSGRLSRVASQTVLIEETIGRV